METRTNHSATRIVALMAVTTLLAGLSLQRADAQLIAYDGFDYEVGNLNEVGGHDNGGGFGWMTTIDPTDNRTQERLDLIASIPGANPLSGIDYGWDDIGWVGNLANPTNAGLSVAEIPTGWGYTDSLGQSLQTSGKIAERTNWDNTNRNFDLSGLDPSLVTTTSANGNFPDTLAVGVSGTEIWFSVLMQGTDGGLRDDGNCECNFPVELMNGFGQAEKTWFGLGRPWKLQLDGSTDDAGGNETYGATYRQGGVRNASANIPWSEKVFMVGRMRYLDPGDPHPNPDPDFPNNDFGDEVFDVWVNPDLGSTPSDADRTIADLLVFDHVVHGIRIGGNADTYVDEIRVGFSYADVAPIAAPTGTPGDFDGDGDVDGADFLVWQRDTSVGSLADLEANFGTTASLATTAVVPEPTSFALIGLALLGWTAIGRNYRS